MKKRIILLLLYFLPVVSYAQIGSFPYRENFDSVDAPLLPSGWSSTKNKHQSGDFSTSSSSPLPGSLPNCIMTSDARVSQTLISPPIDLSYRVVDTLVFYERRSSTFTASVILEAMINDDTTQMITLMDTMKLSPLNNNIYQRRAISLSTLLNNQPLVRFRWRVVGSPTGGISAVLRFDEMSILLKKNIDLALTSVDVAPERIKMGDSLVVSLTIKNAALQGIFAGTIRAVDSGNTTMTKDFVKSLESNESFIITLEFPNISAGYHSMAAHLIVGQDEDTMNNSLHFPVQVGYPPRNILINEIMFAPSTGLPEWIELVNNSQVPIPISGWKISDASSNRAAIYPSNYVLHPYSYAVITTDTNAFKEYGFSACSLLQAAFSTLNNTGDAVVLYDQTLGVIDSLYYSSTWGGGTGKSIERRDTSATSSSQSNWALSTNPRCGTPGYVNSISRKQYDLAFSMNAIFPSFPISTDRLTITVSVKNIGLLQSDGIMIRMYYDTNADSLISDTECIFEKIFSGLPNNDSLTVHTFIEARQRGKMQFIATVSTSNDDDLTNNVIIFQTVIGVPKQSIIINEMMYAPLEDMPEWIECYNRSGESIDITGWKLTDEGSSKKEIQSTSTVQAGAYCIFTADTVAFKNYFPGVTAVFQVSIPPLNNTSPEAIVLFDERGGVMDSIYYRPQWGGKNGHSLQRFDAAGASTDSTNWRSAFPTPGKINALIKKNYDASLLSLLLLTEKPQVNQQMSVTALIKNTGKQSLGNLIVELFLEKNMNGLCEQEELRESRMIPSLSSGESISLTIPLVAESIGKQRIFCHVLASADEDSLNNFAAIDFTVGGQPYNIVINEIMYNPINEEPEWIELFNLSDQSISLEGWKISDNGSSKILLTDYPMIMPPHSYCVITNDSSFQQWHSVTSPVIITPFPSLNNTTPDAVVLFDPLNLVIDSVFYQQRWGGSSGTSLQRYDIFSASADSANWTSSLPTPGRENDISRADDDVEVQSISVLRNEGEFFVAAHIKNSGRNAAENITAVFFHDVNDDRLMQPEELIYSTTLSSLLPLETVTIHTEWSHQSPGEQIVSVAAVYDRDRRPTNNLQRTTVANRYAVKSIVINEILFDPKTRGAEFIELYNRSQDTINLQHWMIKDQPNASGVRASIPLSMSNLFLPINEYFLVASDSSIFLQYPHLSGKPIIIHPALSLNNSGEDVILYDLTGYPIDSVRYSADWHAKSLHPEGRSLERIDPSGISSDGRNWSSSVGSGAATPGEKNSIDIGNRGSTALLSLSPNPFSPDHDGHEDFLSINYSLPTNSSIVRIRIFDIAGRIIRTLASYEPSSFQSSMIWNGLDDEGHRVRMGMYIILLEALDNLGITTVTMKDVAVVAKKL